MQVSYILAGYNEEEIIEESVKKCLKMLEIDFDDYELILVDDASKDNTGKIMSSIAEQNERVIYIENEVNLNFGISVLRGMKAATKEYVVYNAIDLCFPIADTKKIITKAQKYDVLVLQRTVYIGTFWRKITSSINRLLLNSLFPKLMKDTPITNYVQVFRREIIDSIIPLARSPIFVWPEMIFRAKLMGMRVGNVKSIPHVTRIKKGAFGKPHDIIWGIYEMLRFRVRCWQKNI